MLELGWIISQREWASFPESRLRQGLLPGPTLDTDLNPHRHAYSHFIKYGRTSYNRGGGGGGRLSPHPHHQWHTIINNGWAGREVAQQALIAQQGHKRPTRKLWPPSALA